MPEMRFEVRWPDQTVVSCYSPSLVVKEYLSAGREYPLDDFVGRCREALTIASERVRRKYGFACTAAADQLDRIEQSARRFAADAGATVTVTRFVE